MKNLVVLFCLAPVLLSPRLNAQCIADVHYLEQSPHPCHFVGTVDFSNIECVDFSAQQWAYVWHIAGADDGSPIATYYGMAFSHIFEKFGGYDFCLEIHEDGNILSPADYVECLTYTTCEPCGEVETSFEYVECPVGEDCEIQLITKIPAENSVGLKQLASYFVTYQPTPQEILGGVEPIDYEFADIQVQYLPDSGHISVVGDVHVRARRGCFRSRLELKMEYGAGALSMYGGAPCTKMIVAGGEIFRCISCGGDETNGCEASVHASQLSNQDSTCEIYVCPFIGNRSTEFDTETGQDGPKDFSVSPNPAKTEITVAMPQAGHDNLTILLFDAVGKIRLEKEALALNSTDLDVSGLRAGIYLLAVRAEGRVIFTERVMVAR